MRFNVAYGAPAPREGVQPEEGGTLQGDGGTSACSQQGGTDTVVVVQAEPIYTAISAIADHSRRTYKIASSLARSSRRILAYSPETKIENGD